MFIKNEQNSTARHDIFVNLNQTDETKLTPDVVDQFCNTPKGNQLKNQGIDKIFIDRIKRDVDAVLFNHQTKYPKTCQEERAIIKGISVQENWMASNYLSALTITTENFSTWKIWPFSIPLMELKNNLNHVLSGSRQLDHGIKNLTYHTFLNETFGLRILKLEKDVETLTGKTIRDHHDPYSHATIAKAIDATKQEEDKQTAPSYQLMQNSSFNKPVSTLYTEDQRTNENAL